jgi:hypothetical protein
MMFKSLFGRGRSSASSVDWDEIGTLYRTIEGYTYELRTDPLWILVITAKQGHEGSLDEMTIRMASGLTYGPHEIQALAMRPDRKRSD